MPNEVINTINQLAATRNKYKGITFTEKDGNIINDENEDNIEITGVNDETYSPDEETYSPPTEITGVDNETFSPDEEIYSPNEDTYSPPYTARHLHHRSGTRKYSTTRKP